MADGAHEVTINAEEVPVTGEPGIDVAKCIASSVFTDWVSSVDPAFLVERVHLQSVDMFGPNIGFMKFRADTFDRESHAFLPGIVFMRGGSVGILTILVAEESGDEGMVEVPGIVFMRGGAVGVLVILECEGEEHTILTYQARVPVGTANLPEIPAGMLDGSGNFKGVAADEIAEECDLIISEEELVDLTELAYQGKWRGMLPSAGGCDEFLRLYMFRREVEREVLTALEGRLTGLREEGERIKLHLVPLQDCWKMTPDAKALSCITLYEKLAAEGRIKRAIRTFPSSVHELERSEHMMRNSSDMEPPSPTGTIERTESIDEEGEAPPGAEGQTKLVDTAADSISNSTDSVSTQGTVGSMGRQSSRGSSSSKTSATDFVRGGVAPSDRRSDHSTR